MISRPAKVHRRRNRRWVVPAMTLLSGLWMAAAAAETLPPGHIHQNQTWEIRNSPYRLTGTLTVEEGATLTIPSGVKVHFDRGSRLDIKGALIANKAHFDGQDDLHNLEKLHFHPESRGQLVHCILQDLALEVYTSEAVITRSLIANRNGSGITVGRDCRPTITWNDFSGNSYYALYREGRNVFRAPDNFWGAADGPSGAGAGRGNAINAPVDCLPFQKSDIGEHLVLAEGRIERTALEPGSELALTYVMDNYNSYPHSVILGASLSRDSAPHIHSPEHDRRITVPPGRHDFKRAFSVPDRVPEGRYDLLWGVMKADLSAYHVLKKEPGILQIGSAPPAPAVRAAAPGGAPSKTMPY